MKKTRVQYDEKCLKAALKAIEEGQSINSVANHFGIPYSTLRKKNQLKVDGKFLSNLMYFWNNMSCCSDNSSW